MLKYNQRYFQNRRFTIGSNFASNVYVRSIGALCLHGAEKIHCPHRHSVVVGFSCPGDAFWLGRHFQDPVFGLPHGRVDQHSGAGDHHVLRRLWYKLEGGAAGGGGVADSVESGYDCYGGVGGGVLPLCAGDVGFGRAALRRAAFVDRCGGGVFDPALAQSGVERKHGLAPRSRKRLQRPVRVYADGDPAGGDGIRHHRWRDRADVCHGAGHRSGIWFWHRAFGALDAAEGAV